MNCKLNVVYLKSQLPENYRSTLRARAALIVLFLQNLTTA